MAAAKKKRGMGIFRFNFYKEVDGEIVLGLSETGRGLYLLRVFEGERAVKTFSGEKIRKLYKTVKKTARSSNREPLYLPI
ncbi:hypothetical protein KY346_06465 [Candidatus Woesearchaeota archaeon]|nr:hypothetical protein [Candidatus Woesearchaeota archaeon]